MSAAKLETPRNAHLFGHPIIAWDQLNCLWCMVCMVNTDGCTRTCQQEKGQQSRQHQPCIITTTAGATVSATCPFAYRVGFRVRALDGAGSLLVHRPVS